MVNEPNNVLVRTNLYKYFYTKSKEGVLNVQKRHLGYKQMCISDISTWKSRLYQGSADIIKRLAASRVTTASNMSMTVNTSYRLNAELSYLASCLRHEIIIPKNTTGSVSRTIIKKLYNRMLMSTRNASSCYRLSSRISRAIGKK